MQNSLLRFKSFFPQYFVCPALFFMTESILLSMEGTSVAHISGEMFCHSSERIFFSCSFLEGLCCSLHDFGSVLWFIIMLECSFYAVLCQRASNCFFSWMPSIEVDVRQCPLHSLSCQMKLCFNWFCWSPIFLQPFASLWSLTIRLFNSFFL